MELLKLDIYWIALSRLILFASNALVTSEIPQTVLSVVAENPDDDKFIECAVATKARYIFSADQHLKAINKYVGIRILSPNDFLVGHRRHEKQARYRQLNIGTANPTAFQLDQDIERALRNMSRRYL